MTTAFLFMSFLLAATFFALAAGELRGIRQTVLERSDRLTAELNIVEAVLAEHRNILDDFRKEFGKQFSNQNDNVLNISRFLSDMGKDVVRIREIQKGLENQDAVLNDLKNDLSALTSRAGAEDAAHERLALLAAGMEELRKSAPAQDEALRQLKDKIGQMSRELSIAAESGVIAGERESILSKAMEEGVMNLMQYAAGKTSGGVEVGLG